MATIRVTELAQELGLTYQECLDLCMKVGIGPETHISGIEEAQADKVRRRAERDGLGRFNQPETSDAQQNPTEPPGGTLPQDRRPGDEATGQEPRRDGGSRRPSLDIGLVLLDPITTEEWRGVEPVLSLLWRALDETALTETQQEQILAMARLIEAERERTTPGETKRWRLVGVVGGALRYLAREAPKDVLAWWKLAEILSQIGWHDVARSLPT